jgi:hypothetical protein
MLTRLTSQHLDLFLELKDNNPGQWKLGLEYDNRIDNVLFFNERICHSQAYSIGWIKSGKLLSMTTLFQTPHAPTWFWLYYANIKMTYTNFNTTHGLEIINEMFLEAIKRKLSSCIYLARDNFPSFTSDATGKMKNKIASWHNQVPEIKKYHWVDEYKILANTNPPYEYMRWLMGYQTWPLDLRIRAGTLKQEYRKEILSF